MKHKIASLLIAGIMVCASFASASATEASLETKSDAEGSAISVGADRAAENDASTSAMDPALKYPTEIQYPADKNGVIMKTYMVKNADDIDDIEKADITYQGVLYRYQDIAVTEQPFHDEKNYIETLTGESETDNKDDILATLDLQRKVTTEDGYTGLLDLDITSLTTDVTEYGYSTKTKTVTKSYSGLSDADLTFIPKTVTESGVTCSLVDVKWAEASIYNPYDPDYGTRFNATATYQGNYSSSYAKGYSYAVKYYGTITKDEITGYECTLMFAPEIEDHWYDVFVGDESNPAAVFGALVVLCLLLACAVFTVYALIKRRRQEVVTTEEIIDDGETTDEMGGNESNQ